MIIEIPDFTEGFSKDVIDEFRADILKRMSVLTVMCRDYKNVNLIADAVDILNKIDIESEKRERNLHP